MLPGTFFFRFFFGAPAEPAEQDHGVAARVANSGAGGNSINRVERAGAEWYRWSATEEAVLAGDSAGFSFVVGRQKRAGAHSRLGRTGSA